MTITEFLLARIAEKYEEAVRMAGSPFLAQQVGSARVLAECKAMREIVEWWAPWDGEVYDGWTDAANVVLPILASVYADHPDYREEWRA